MNLGFKKAGIRQWIANHPGLSETARQRVMADNEQMVNNLKLLNLPTDRDFGSFDDIGSAEASIPESYRQNCLFIIRCPHRTKAVIERKLFVPWNEVVDFVSKLPGGYREYRLGIREVSTPLWSGTIISSQGGQSVLVELWKGKHLLMDEGSEKDSFRGEYNDSPTAPHRYVWSEGCTDELKQIMLGAIRYIAPDLLPKRSMFVEFSLTERGYRFIGASFDPFWTERNAPRTASRPFDGD